jgi:ABC-type amino acid transport substrate-binding protein
VATRPLHLDPALQDAVDRAREALAASGELQPKPGPYASPLGERERAAVARILRDGTYRRLADAVGAVDPELADL